MMLNNKLTRLLLGIVIVLMVITSGAYAYMFKATDIKENKFTPSVLECKVSEVFQNNQKTSIKVMNTSKSNNDAYLRVRFVSYWVKKNGSDYEIVGKPSIMPSIEMEPGWIKSANSDTYYYTVPVSPGKYTGELLKEDTVIQLAEDGDYLQVVEVFADAIQALGTTDVGDIPAVVAAWGVKLDSSGSIVSAP